MVTNKAAGEGRPPVWYLVALLALLVPATLVSQWWGVAGATLWTPEVGVAFAALVLYGTRALPPLILVETLVIRVDFADRIPLWVMAAVSAAMVGGYAVGLPLLRRTRFHAGLRRVTDAALLAAAGAVGAVCSGLLFAAVLVAWRPQTRSMIWQVLRHYPVGATAGTFTVAPILILAGSHLVRSQRAAGRPATADGPDCDPVPVTRGAAAEAVAVVIAFVIAAHLGLAHSGGGPVLYPLLLPLVWAALRLGITGTATGVTVGSLAITGLGHTSGLPPAEVGGLETFLAVFCLAGLFLGAAQTERLDDRRRLEAGREALRRSEERLRLLVDSGSDYAMFMVGPDGKILTWNTGAQHLSGYRPEEIIGRDLAVLHGAADTTAGDPGRASVDRELQLAAMLGRYTEESWRVRKDGSRYWANVLITALHDDRGELCGYSKVILDLTERRAAEDRLTALATHDPLTGLANRAHLEDRLCAALARADRSSTPVGVLFVDLDGFKQINDHWGHATGDRVLSIIGERLQALLGSKALAARLGGDEFVIVCDDPALSASLAALAASVRATIEEPIRLGDASFSVGASIGRARSRPGQTPADLLDRADAAMYRAKNRRQRMTDRVAS